MRTLPNRYPDFRFGVTHFLFPSFGKSGCAGNRDLIQPPLSCCKEDSLNAHPMKSFQQNLHRSERAPIPKLAMRSTLMRFESYQPDFAPLALNCINEPTKRSTTFFSAKFVMTYSLPRSPNCLRTLSSSNFTKACLNASLPT